MAIDWDKLQVKVIDDDHIPITDDYKYTMSSEQRMVIFAGRKGEQGPAGPAGPVGPAGPAGPAGGASWGNIDGDIENQNDLANALAMKANVADLGDLATKDTADYETEVTNKPTLGSLASKDNVNYATEVTNKPSLGTMASVNDAPSDSKEYVRKNGAWSEATGGIASVSWGDISGTLANQTDLQTALDAKADEADLGALATKDTVDYQTEVTNKPSTFPPEAHIHDDRYYTESETDALLDGKASVIIGPVPVKLSGTYIVVPVGAKPIDFKATLQVTQTGSGTPSAVNIRPFESAEFCIVVIADSYGDIAATMVTRNISLPSTIYGGVVDVINGKLTITYGHIASYNGETLPGVWYSDRDVYASGTTPTVGAEVVYELETPIEQTCSSFMPTMFSNRDTYLWASHQSVRLSVTNYTVAGALDIYEQEIIDTKTYIDQKDALKANVSDLGDLATQDTVDYETDVTNKPSVFPPSAHAHDDRYYTESEIDTSLAGKQNTLTFDSAPTSASTNPVTSGGVYDAIVSGFRDVYKVTLPAASSSKLTFSAPGITADHVLCVEGHAYYTNKSAVMGELTLTTAANSITITGTLSGTTDIVVTLGIPRTITAS